MYSRTAPLRFLHTETPMLQTAHLVPEKPEFIQYSLHLLNADISVIGMLLSAPLVSVLKMSHWISLKKNSFDKISYSTC